MRAIIPLVMILVLALTVSAWAISYPRYGYYSQPIQCQIGQSVYTMTRYDCDYNMGFQLMNGDKVKHPLDTGWRTRSFY